MKKDCLSEEILHRHSTKNPPKLDKFHYKRRSFDGKAGRISQDDKNILLCSIIN
jgi:hypothetical protein